MVVNICDLNTDCLKHIFSFCDEADLDNLSIASPFFKMIIEYYLYFSRSIDLLMSGHRGRPSIMQRTFDSLTYLERFKIERNWRVGRYSESYFPQVVCYPKILLEKEYLYTTYYRFLRIYKRLEHDIINHIYVKEIVSHIAPYITTFAKENDTLFIGMNVKTGFIYENDIITKVQLYPKDESLLHVDFHDNLYIAACANATRLYQRSDELGFITLNVIKQFDEGVKVARFTSDYNKLYAVICTDETSPPMREIDLHTGRWRVLNSTSYLVRDIRVKDDNVVLTANEDGTFRMNDRRVDSDVAIWKDPHGVPLFYLQYDGLHAVLCGVQVGPKLTLYDIRMRNDFIQLYRPRSASIDGTPSLVSDLACDSRYIFLSTDRSIQVLDFKSNWAKASNLKEIF